MNSLLNMHSIQYTMDITILLSKRKYRYTDVHLPLLNLFTRIVRIQILRHL